MKGVDSKYHVWMHYEMWCEKMRQVKLEPKWSVYYRGYIEHIHNHRRHIKDTDGLTEEECENAIKIKQTKLTDVFEALRL